MATINRDKIKKILQTGYIKYLEILINEFGGRFNAHQKMSDMKADLRGARDGKRYQEEYYPSYNVYVNAGERNASVFTSKQEAAQRYLAAWLRSWSD